MCRKPNLNQLRPMLKKTLPTVRSAPVVDLVDMTVIIAMKMTVTLKKAMNFDMLVCLYVMLDTHHIFMLLLVKIVFALDDLLGWKSW